MKKANIISLGCSKNLVDTEMLLKQLERAGYATETDVEESDADVVIVGAGPGGIFTALEMLRRGSKKKIVMVEKGRELTRRSCPKSKTGQLVCGFVFCC